MKRLRVLVSSFACSPYHGSEKGAGWNVISRLARYHDVTVLVGDMRNGSQTKSELERWFSEHGAIPNLRTVYIAPSLTVRIFVALHKIPLFWPLYYVGYDFWQKQAYKKAAELHRAENYDLAHQFTYHTIRNPGYLWNLGIPFFWGPFSGATMVPWSFLWFSGITGVGRIYFRNILNSIQLALAFKSRKAGRKARKLWCSGIEDKTYIEKNWGVRAEILNETGTDAGCIVKKQTHDRNPTLHLCWSGLHVPRKALPLVFQALNQIPESFSWTLTVMGDGPMNSRWKSQLKKLVKIRDKVRFTGSLPKSEALKTMAKSDVFLHSSIKEASSSVVMEALSLGLPVVCHDISGMSNAIDDTCGMKIPLLSPRRSIEGFREAILRILRDPALLEALSEGATARASELSWDRMASRIATAYAETVT